MAADREETHEAARRELIIQSIGIVAMATAGLLSVFIQRHMSDPDYLRRIKMRAAKESERWNATKAAAYWKRAEAARRRYESERGV